VLIKEDISRNGHIHPFFICTVHERGELLCRLIVKRRFLGSEQAYTIINEKKKERKNSI
jgi:hypothetical protein